MARHFRTPSPLAPVRAGAGGSLSHRPFVGTAPAIPAPHPDAALLALCAELRLLQEAWQRLWNATPEDGDETPADLAWRQYSEWTWPCTRGCPDDPAHKLISLKATTPEGLRAKAAAVKAIQDAAGYELCCRDDEGHLVASLLEDAAGPLACLWAKMLHQAGRER